MTCSTVIEVWSDSPLVGRNFVLINSVSVFRAFLSSTYEEVPILEVDQTWTTPAQQRRRHLCERSPFALEIL